MIEPSIVLSADLLSYIDPGTVQTMFSGLAPILAAVGSALLILLWPFRFLYYQARARYARLPLMGRVAMLSLAVALAAGTAAGSYVAVSHLLTSRSVPASTASTATEIVVTKPIVKRVIVLGMDGLDPNVVAQLIADGELPHFALLAQQGAFVPLATSRPPASPVAWSTIATGTHPGEHGIFDFIHRLPSNYLPFLSLRNARGGFLGTHYEPARQREGFWYYTSRAHLPTTVIRWPITFPAEQVEGRFLSGFGVPDLLGGEGQYTFFTSAPVDEDDPGLHHVRRVEWDGQRLETHLRGPAVGEEQYSQLDLEIQRVAPDRLRISLPTGVAVDATLDTWSDWLPLSFSVGLGRSVHGACKFLLASIDDELRLTASPIHIDPVQQAFPITSPPEFGAELQSDLGRFHTLGMPEQIQPLTHGRYDYDAFLSECATVHNERARMLRRELARFDSGLLAFVFDTSDRIQHAFWATRDPLHPAYDSTIADQYAQVIPQAYRDLDAVLAEVLPHVDQQTALVVVSDHGFSSFRRALNVNRWLIDHGYLVLEDDAAVGDDLFRNVDWTRTRAYAFGFSSICLNVRGRERKGIVPPGPEQEALCRNLAQQLLDWRDPATDQPVIHSVELTTQIYPGPATADAGPDLILGLKPGYRVSWQTALGGAPADAIEDNLSRWTGDHLIDPSFVPGILLTNRPIQVDDPAQADIAPSILHLLGIKPPAHMTGRVILD